MRCYDCGESTGVIDSRARKDGIHRRRQCTRGHRFNTVEFVEGGTAYSKRVLEDRMLMLMGEVMDTMAAIRGITKGVDIPDT